MRTWFITGVARGDGVAIAKRALEFGDSVVATVRNPARVRAALGEHRRLLMLPLEVTHEAHVRAVVATALKRFGRIDVLVNNPSYGLLGAIEEASAADVERVFRTNVFGLLNVTRAVLPQLRKQRSGHIVNISSVGKQRAAAGWGLYSATKSAVEAISEALSKEGEPLGIYTTLVEPAHFRTDLVSSTGLVRAAQHIADYGESLGATHTFSAGQPGGQDELADAILSLVNAADPPRHLALRSHLRSMTEAKAETAVHEVEPWRSLVLSTDWAS